VGRSVHEGWRGYGVRTARRFGRNVTISFAGCFGYTSNEAVGKSILILFPPERTSEETAIINRISRGERIEHYQAERVRMDGTRINLSLSISPIKDSSGQIIGASKFARDITEQLKQQALKESEERLRAVLEASPECVKIVTQEGTLQYINQAGLCMIECDGEKARIGKVGELISPEHRQQWIEIQASLWGRTLELGIRDHWTQRDSALDCYDIRLGSANNSAPGKRPRLHRASQTLDRRTHFRLDQSLPTQRSRLRTKTRTQRSHDPSRHDRAHVQATRKSHKLILKQALRRNYALLRFESAIAIGCANS